MGLFDLLKRGTSNPAWLKQAVAAKQLSATTPAEAAEYADLMQKIKALDVLKGGIDPNTAFLLRKSLEMQRQSAPSEAVQQVLSAVKPTKGATPVPGMPGGYYVDPKELSDKTALTRALSNLTSESKLSESDNADMAIGALQALKNAASPYGSKTSRGLIKLDPHGRVSGAAAVDLEKAADYGLQGPMYLDYLSALSPDVKGRDMLRALQDKYGADTAFQVLNPEVNESVYRSMGATPIADDPFGGAPWLPSYRIQQRIPETRPIPQVDETQMSLPGFADGGSVSPFSDRRGEAQRMSHMPRNDKYLETVNALKAGASNWIPGLAATPGDIADALAYAARRVAQGQSQKSVPSLGWGQASRAAVKQALNMIPPPSDVPEMSAPYEPSALESATEMLNPALLNPAAAARGGLNTLKGYGKLAAEAVARGVESGSPLTAMIQPMNVVKQKGGNWLSGSVEDALRGLKPAGIRAITPEEASMLGVDRDIYNAGTSPSKTAIDSWIDKQLTRYVKNQMATPEDPVRALAEKGVLHVEPEGLQRPRQMSPLDDVMRQVRVEAGFPESGVAHSQLAKDWETASDALTGRYSPEGLSDSTIAKNPWLSNLQPGTMVHDINTGFAGHNMEPLGLPHLIDELKNALNPESGLPRNLQLTPQKMQNLGIEGAVQRVSEINKWRAAQKAEADALKANNAATVVHKEYPENNPLGLKWVELKAPEGTNPAYLGEGRYEDEAANTLKDALKYEGDTMGHCVGGYCDDVLSGQSRIFSLRDAKGQPHVTIETRPGTAPSFREAMLQAHDEGLYDEDEISKRAQELMTSQQPQSIVQIKGKANRPPNQEYLPFVQDFVKSGQWSDVGDLGSTGLIKHEPTGKYITQDQANALANKYFGENQFGNKPGGNESPSQYFNRVSKYDPSMLSDTDKDFINAWGSGEGFAHGGSVPVKQKTFTSNDLHAIIAALEAQTDA